MRTMPSRTPASTPLKRVLQSEGRKQSWLAEQVGIDQPTLSRIVNGLHCDEGTRQKISAALGREVCDLWPTADADELEAA